MNTQHRPLSFDWDCPADPDSGRSSRTLMASLHRIRALRPRVFRLENVGNCEMKEVMGFIRGAIPGYDLGLFQANAADFHCCSERDRQWLVGVRHGCLRAPFEEWEDHLLALRSPRHAQSPCQHLLRNDSPPCSRRAQTAEGRCCAAGWCGQVAWSGPWHSVGCGT